VRSLAGILLGLIARLWLATLKVEIRGMDHLGAAGDRPWVLCFLHGTQFPLLAWRRRRRTVALVSHSADGAMQASALRCQGLDVVRGSSSRGGARGLAAIIRQMRRHGSDAAFAVDGPRGPYGVVKEGAIAAARASGALLVPMGSHVRRGWVARQAWDRFALPRPFSRVVVAFATPIDPSAADARVRLEEAIRRANEDSLAV
jgi:lysophospholipid acyltransferase (LPLAT)-like uncharacterized protein